MSDWTPTVGAETKPAPHRLRWALLNIGLPVAAVNSGITQWVASRLHYHEALGWNVHGAYAPWDWMIWRSKGWPGAAPTFELLDNILSGAACLAPALAGAWLSKRQSRPKKHEGVHGTAKFATRPEMVSAGLLPAVADAPHRGLYLGIAEDGSYLRHEGPEPILVSCPTRGGKTQGPVIMNVLSQPDESVIVYDIRGDVYEKTAGWRHAEGNRVLKWDMMAPSGSGAVRWNPLREVRLGTHNEFADVAGIIEIVADPQGEGLDNPRDHFPPVAADFLVSLSLFCLYEARARNQWASFGTVRDAMSDPNRPPQALYQAMVDNTFGTGGSRHSGIAQGGADQLGRADRERASVLSTCTRMLRLFRDPVVAQNTSRSDFRLADVMDGERPAALYVIPREAHSQRMRPLLRLFTSMLTKRVLEGEFTGATSKAHKYRCKLLWDEFAEAKRMDAFLDDMARLSGAGFRTMLIVQDYQQIVREYGQDEPVTGHCHVMLAYPPNNTRTAEWIESWLGRTTIITEDVSTSGTVGEAKRGYSMHYSTVSRSLLTADEISRLPKPKKDQEGRILEPGQLLLKIGGSKPVLATQALYFMDPVFLHRASIPPPASASAATRRIPA